MVLPRRGERRPLLPGHRRRRGRGDLLRNRDRPGRPCEVLRSRRRLVGDREAPAGGPRHRPVQEAVPRPSGDRRPATCSRSSPTRSHRSRCECRARTGSRSGSKDGLGTSAAGAAGRERPPERGSLRLGGQSCLGAKRGSGFIGLYSLYTRGTRSVLSSTPEGPSHDDLPVGEVLRHGDRRVGDGLTGVCLGVPPTAPPAAFSGVSRFSGAGCLMMSG